jgi:hypothetical protein
LVISYTGGDKNTSLKENHRSYSIEEFEHIINLLQRKYFIKCKLIVLKLFPPQDQNVKFTKINESLEIYELHVKLWGALLDIHSEKLIKNIFLKYSFRKTY